MNRPIDIETSMNKKNEEVASVNVVHHNRLCFQLCNVSAERILDYFRLRVLFSLSSAKN
jgi:hypothetical protein